MQVGDRRSRGRNDGGRASALSADTQCREGRRTLVDSYDHAQGTLAFKSGRRQGECLRACTGAHHDPLQAVCHEGLEHSKRRHRCR